MIIDSVEEYKKDIEGARLFADNDTHIPHKQRIVVDILAQTLAKTYMLSLSTFKCYFGIQKYQHEKLYNFLIERYKDLTQATHEISIYIRELGYEVPESMHQVLKFAENKNEDGGIEMMGTLLEVNGEMVQFLRNAVRKLYQVDSKAIGLLEKRLRIHEDTVLIYNEFESKT
jgi:DNA-binding ferritin-like protein